MNKHTRKAVDRAVDQQRQYNQAAEQMARDRGLEKAGKIVELIILSSTIESIERINNANYTAAQKKTIIGDLVSGVMTTCKKYTKS